MLMNLYILHRLVLTIYWKAWDPGQVMGRETSVCKLCDQVVRRDSMEIILWVEDSNQLDPTWIDLQSQEIEFARQGHLQLHPWPSCNLLTACTEGPWGGAGRQQSQRRDTFSVMPGAEFFLLLMFLVNQVLRGEEGEANTLILVRDSFLDLYLPPFLPYAIHLINT